MIHNKIFKTTINLIPNPIIVTSGKQLVQANDDFLDFFAYETLEAFVKEHLCVCNLFVNYKDYFSLEKLATLQEDVLWTEYVYNYNQTHEDNITVSMLDKDAEPTAYEITVNKLPQYEGHFIVAFTDITSIQKEKKLLEAMAYHDPLTNIYNRQIFDKMLQKEKENKRRHGDTLSLIMLDIDHFKRVNDTYGHSIGDKVLITLTQLISENLRTNDIFARWGGEEFMILLPRTTPKEAYKKAQNLRKILEEYVDDLLPTFTVSFGVTELLTTDKERSCFQRVDEALYKAKIKRNDVVLL